MSQHIPPLDMAAQTDIGLKRQKNEDNFGYQVPAPNSAQYSLGALFIVADGMGGMGGGDVASRIAVQTLVEEFYAAAVPDRMAALRTALEAANTAVRDQAAKMNRLRIGSTASGLVLLPGGEALWFNVGDARVYRVRQNLIEQVSHDQSVLQHQLDAGVISEEDAKVARNVNVTMFIGQPTPVQPVYGRAHTQPGDVFIMCSDGLWDLVESTEMYRIVQRMPAKAAARKLIDLARKRGGPDNITVIIVRVGPGGPKGGLLKKWWVIPLVLLLAGGAVAAGILLSSGGEEKDTANTESAAPPTTAAAVVAVVEATPTETAAATDTLAPSATAAAVISVHTATPTTTFTPSVTATSTNTPSATSTATATDTPTVTLTSSATATATATETASATPTETSTAVPTETASAIPTETATPTATLTNVPTSTSSPKPTVTVNPAIITWTPTVPPTATPVNTIAAPPTVKPTLSPAEQQLVFAAEEGVLLSAPTRLYFLYTVDFLPPTVISEADLPAGTHLRLLDEVQQPHPDDSAMILRHVIVVGGPEREKDGWVEQTALENSIPAVPRVTPAQGVLVVNVRSGDDREYDEVGELLAGEFAKVLAISDRSGWYQVELSDGTQGWISNMYVDVTGDLSQVTHLLPPVQTAVPTTPAAALTSPPKPSFTPAPTGSPEFDNPSGTTLQLPGR